MSIDRNVKITITIYDDESRSAEYDTKNQRVIIKGDLFPRDILLISQLTNLVKMEQKHGPQSIIYPDQD